MQKNVWNYQVKEEAEGDNMVQFLKRLMSEKLEIPEKELRKWNGTTTTKSWSVCMQ